jgi:hypothetical protein
MNDKIQKLYEEASLTEGPSGSRYSLPDEFVEKLVGLVVTDVCAKLEPVLAQEIADFYGVKI